MWLLCTLRCLRRYRCLWLGQDGVRCLLELPDFVTDLFFADVRDLEPERCGFAAAHSQEVAPPTQ